MKNLQSHFKFNKQERSGIFFLLLVIVLLQIGYFLLRSSLSEKGTDSFSLKGDEQAQIDALKENAQSGDTLKIFPFNPNYISDYKGYTLGLSVDEIDRLHAFRAQNKFVNSPEDFQTVTRISDSLLETISPYFKFPEWTQKRGKLGAVGNKRHPSNEDSKRSVKNTFPVETLANEVVDLNQATTQDLKQINGIGEKLSVRIVKFRDRLGGFLVEDQLYDVYGLAPEVVERTLKRFKVLEKPDIARININTASAEEISKLIYIQKHIAERIVDYRNVNGGIGSFEELKKIEDFPSGKIARIALYLSL